MKTISFITLIFISINCTSQNTVKNISNIAKNIDTTEVRAFESAIERVYGKDYGDSINDYYSIEKNGYLITQKTIGIYNEKWSENTKYTLTISKYDTIYFEKVINNLEPVTLTPDSRNIEVEIYNDIAYILYINGNGEKNIKQRMYLSVVNLKSGKTIKNKLLYEQQYGISNLRISLNSTFEKLLIAYTDISKPNSENLIYSVYDLRKFEFSIKPESIVLFDKWEKVNPTFVKCNSEIYLFNETGKEYGAFGVTGEPAMAFSIINKENRPENYKVIKENGQIFYQYIYDNYLYYKLQVKSDKIELKKIELKKL